MDSRKAWRMDTAERTNNIIQQDKQHLPAGKTKKIQQVRQHNHAGQTAYSSRSNKKSSRTNNIKTSIRK